MTDTCTPCTPPAALEKNDLNLIWIDCEMTGLDPEVDRLLEVAIVATSPDLAQRVDGPVLVIHQSDEQLARMDAWNQSTHGKTGLTEKVRASTLGEDEAQEQLIAFMRQYVSKGASPMCGNTIGQDRRFLLKYMPRLEALFHYRGIDVSTLKELARRWRPQVMEAFKKQQSHTALADVHESIDELLHYRREFMRI
ncbi:MAG: oligoribonuclease [Burkholderiaceae bacterium]|nr:oligoribonuclease [Burkholderiaceae bacterium]